MNDKRSGAMAVRVANFRRNIKSLRSVAVATKTQEKDTMKSYVRLSEILQRLARQEESKTLQRGVKALAETLSAIESHRDTLVIARLESSMLQKLKELDDSCNIPTTVLLKDRNNSIKSSVKYKEQFQAMAAKPTTSQRKLEKKKIQLHEEEKRVKTIDAGLQKNLLLYEAKRIEDCKDAFDDFIKGQLLYHCRAVEALTAAMKIVSSIDPNAGTEQLREDLSMSLSAQNAPVQVPQQIWNKENQTEEEGQEEEEEEL